MRRSCFVLSLRSCLFALIYSHDQMNVCEIVWIQYVYLIESPEIQVLADARNVDGIGNIKFWRNSEVLTFHEYCWFLHD